MVKHTTLPDVRRAADAARLRAQAGDLLQRLIDARRLSEERSAENGRRDPMKSVTGRSALDKAIAAVRIMIDDMDELLSRSDQSLEADTPRRAHITPHLLGAVG